MVNEMPLKKTQILELQFIQFIADNNCPLLFADNLTHFSKTNLHDSSTLKDIHFYRKKASGLISDVIKPFIQDSLDDTLSRSLFSLIADETTDKSKTKQLALMVQYWEPGAGSKCVLHSLVDCSAGQDHEELFEIIRKKILTKPYSQNLVAFTSDGAPVLRGKKNSVLQKLKKRYPQL